MGTKPARRPLLLRRLGPLLLPGALLAALVAYRNQAIARNQQRFLESVAHGKAEPSSNGQRPTAGGPKIEPSP